MREYTNEDLAFEYQTISVLEASSSLVTVDQDAPIEVTAQPVENPDGTSEATSLTGPATLPAGSRMIRSTRQLSRWTSRTRTPECPSTTRPSWSTKRIRVRLPLRIASTPSPDDAGANLDTTADADQPPEPDKALGSSDDSDLGTTAESLPPATWRNLNNPLDVDGLNGVTPLDVLITINYLNEHAGDSALPPLADGPPPFYYDVNGNHLCTPHDALLVINFLTPAQSESAEGESEPAAEQRSPLTASLTGVPPTAKLDAPALPRAKAFVDPWLADDELEDAIDLIARESGDGHLASDTFHDGLLTDLAFALAAALNGDRATRRSL